MPGGLLVSASNAIIPVSSSLDQTVALSCRSPIGSRMVPLRSTFGPQRSRPPSPPCSERRFRGRRSMVLPMRGGASQTPCAGCQRPTGLAPYYFHEDPGMTPSRVCGALNRTLSELRTRYQELAERIGATSLIRVPPTDECCGTGRCHRARSICAACRPTGLPQCRRERNSGPRPSETAAKSTSRSPPWADSERCRRLLSAERNSPAWARRDRSSGPGATACCGTADCWNRRALGQSPRVGSHGERAAPVPNERDEMGCENSVLRTRDPLDRRCAAIGLTVGI